MSEYNASNYKIFEDAVGTITKFNGDVEKCNTALSEGKKNIGNESIFMGPIADECSRGFTEVEGLLTKLKGDTNTFSKYLTGVEANYKSGDTKAANTLISDDNGFKIGTGTTTVDANNIPQITVSQVQNCSNVQEYLDLVMPVYSYYCKKYGIKYPGVLALQPVHEHSAPTGIHAQSAVEDNNLGGLKYASSIPNATPGSYPSDGTGGQYSHFENVTQYIEAACWNIAHDGSYYQNALAQNNMGDFTRSLVNTWVGHPDNYGPSIVNEYSQYGLEKYEL